MPSTQLLHLLSDELAALREFIALLKEEQTTLAEGKADALPSLIDRKSALATRLGDCSARRDAALAVLALPAGRSGMETWLESQPSTSPARRDWLQLLPLAAEARSLNELNGKLIGTRLQHNQQALTALMGATERAMTYGPDGHTQISGGGRSRGSA